MVHAPNPTRQAVLYSLRCIFNNNNKNNNNYKNNNNNNNDKYSKCDLNCILFKNNTF